MHNTNLRAPNNVSKWLYDKRFIVNVQYMREKGTFFKSSQNIAIVFAMPLEPIS